MRYRRPPVHSLAFALAICMATLGRANPVNPVVASGTASFATSGNTLIVTNSANAIINWQAFSIGQGEATRFVQPNAASAVLNRVTGQDPSQILGQLQSNGKVFLINPNGILFGKDARIDVAGLVASTLNLSDQDFLDGRYNFAGDGTNGVVNLGTISTPAGGSVYLVGGSVRNEGVVTSPKGEIILAAGQSVRLVDTATPNVQVEIAAPAGEAINLGSLVASGGSIDIHAATVNQRGIVNADALTRDDQGRIRLIASGTTTLGAGSVTSAANGAGGAGGFIETSGAHVRVEDGAGVSTAAPQGTAGRWLIDPVDFNIAASGGDITGAALNALLGSNSIVIQTATGSNSATNLYGSVGTNGDIFVNDAVSWSANKLTLSAYRNIYVNQALNGSGTASLALEYGQGAVAAGNTADYVIAAGIKVTLPAGNNFSTKLGSDGATNAYTVITSLGAPGSVTTTDLQGISGGLSGLYALGADIDASPTSGWAGGFLPIGSPGSLATAFTGTFTGLGHTVTGLTINRPGTGNVGLFGYAGYVAFPTNVITPAAIRDVGLVGGSVSGNFNVGGLVGYLRAGSTVANSYNTGTVTGANAGFNVEAGGLVGIADGDILNSYSTGNVTASAGNHVGGLAGSGNGAVTNSYSTGNVSGNNWVGGLVGSTSTATVIARSYSTGSVSGNSSVGGLVGYYTGTSISNAYSTGAVNGNIYVGGLVGYIGGGNPIANTYSTGAVTGGANVGGLVGWNNGNSVSNSFWDTTTSGQPTAGVGFGFTAGVTGMATADMKIQANFTSATAANGNVNPNWDFAATWVMTNGVSYPMLRAFMIPLTVSASAASKIYDGLAFSGGNGATYSGFTGGDTAAALSGALAFGGTAQGAINAGSYSIVPSGYSSTKYNITYVNGALTISPAPLTVTANNASKTYDSLAYSGGNGVGYAGFVNGDSAAVLGGTLAYGGTSQGAVNAGSYTIVPSGLTAANYSLAYVNGTLTVAAAASSPPAPSPAPAAGPSASPPTAAAETATVVALPSLLVQTLQAVTAGDKMVAPPDVMPVPAVTSSLGTGSAQDCP